MNYMAEIKLFNEWLETGELSTSGIALWYALMYIANRSGWKPELSVPVSAIMLRTGLSRSAVYKERNVLRDNGLIEFTENAGRQSSTYRICSFESRLASTVVSTARTQMETQPETQTGEASTLASAPRTQTETESGFASTTATQPCTIYKPKHDLSSKKRDKSSSGKKEKSCAKKEPTLEAGAEASLLGYAPQGGGRRSQKTGFDLSFASDPIWEDLLHTWFEYKRSRNQGYKSELSVRKFLTMLRNLSRGDPETARQIIDKSIASNWAGIFELKDSGGQARGQPATGQRIGQIKQPEDEARRQKLLEKFDKRK